MSRTKRLLSYGTESRVKVARSATVASKTKARNKKLLSGPTNVSNRTMTFAYPITGLVPTSTTATHTVFRANSVYDPDYSWGGEQCYGHASMTDRFERYYVKKSKFTLLGGDYTVDNSVAQVYAYVWADTSETFGGGNDLNTIHGMCTANGGKIFKIPNQEQTKTVIGSVRCTTKDYYSHGYGDKDNNSLCLANPQNLLYWHLVVVCVTSQPNYVAKVDVTVQVDYDTLYYDPIDKFS